MSTVEFAIIDDQGVQYGLPAKTFTDAGAAKKALDFLEEHRLAMKHEAVAAEAKLNAGVGVNEGLHLQDAVARWKAEEKRVWTVFGRTVTDWEKVDDSWHALMCT